VSLADYKGRWVVLYFYPKDRTSGCTLEAHNFQRDLRKYDALHAVVLGVSFDTVESHKTFCTKDSLTFKLLPTRIIRSSTPMAYQSIRSGPCSTRSASPS
jgi:peroxiredoxin Q/BCP